jgi:hypothetical protein
MNRKSLKRILGLMWMGGGLMNGRWFGGQQIEAHIHDGNPIYHVQKETEEDDDETERLKKYAEWLESQK